MARDTNFYYSFLVLTPARRQAIVAVWDFCRAVDDAVDEARVETEADRAAAHARLDEWRREIARCFATDDAASTPQTPQGRALVPFIRQFDLPRGPLADLVDGVAMDIGHRRFKNFAELYQVPATASPRRSASSASRSSAARTPSRATTRRISGWRCSSPTSCAT